MEERGNALRQSERAEFRRLNVLLDARKIKGGGIGTYTVNLIRGLASNDGVRLSILSNPENLYRINLPHNVKVIAEKAKCYSLEEYFLMSSRLPFQDYDVFHVPHYTLPFGIPIPTIVTIHDLIHIYKPERFFYPFFAKPLVRSALKRATRVITVSNASFQEIKHFAKQNPLILEKMRIVPNSIDLDMLKPDVENGPSAVSTTRKGDYFLAVFSNSKPHKGMKDLITAYRELRSDQEGGGERLLNKRLVLVGPGTENIKGHDFGSEAGSSAELIVLGEVSREALRRLYLNAAAVIIPSTAEGFCLQALEAHSLGVPVIARPVAAILELTTSCDIVCSDFSVESLKRGIMQFLSNSTLSLESIENLRRQAEKYRPEDSAEAVIDVYRDALGVFSGAAV